MKFGNIFLSLQNGFFELLADKVFRSTDFLFADPKVGEMDMIELFFVGKDCRISIVTYVIKDGADGTIECRVVEVRT